MVAQPKSLSQTTSKPGPEHSEGDGLSNKPVLITTHCADATQAQGKESLRQPITNPALSCSRNGLPGAMFSASDTFSSSVNFCVTWVMMKRGECLQDDESAIVTCCWGHHILHMIAYHLGFQGFHHSQAKVAVVSCKLHDLSMLLQYCPARMNALER